MLEITAKEQKCTSRYFSSSIFFFKKKSFGWLTSLSSLRKRWLGGAPPLPAAASGFPRSHSFYVYSVYADDCGCDFHDVIIRAAS